MYNIVAKAHTSQQVATALKSNMDHFLVTTLDHYSDEILMKPTTCQLQFTC